MAAALLDGGARVAVAGRDRGRADAVAAELGGGTAAAFGVQMDVRDEHSVGAGVAAVHDAFGGLDVLVNNAGIGMRTVNPRFMTEPQGFWAVDPQRFRDVFATNVTGYFLVAQAVVPSMLAAGSGKIVNVSINETTMRRHGFTPYGPSRAASEALSSVMAADLAGTGVSVNLLAPGGATATGMIPEDVPEEVRGRLLDPSIMGPPVRWLASHDSDGTTGTRVVATEFLARQTGR